MTIVIAVASIFVLTGLAWAVGKFLPFRVCPICTGVSGTWIWMLVGMAIGQLPVTSYQLPVALLMGGTVVGLAYQLEKRLPTGDDRWQSPLLWKILFIPTGFFGAYSLIGASWNLFAAAIVILAAIAVLFFYRGTWVGEPPSKKDQAVAELEKKMKQCC